MTDQLEHDLASLFGSTATEADVPPLPLADLIAQGRSLQRVRRRRAAIWTSVAAAAAVVAVTVPIAVSAHRHSGSPAPAHRTATTSPTPNANGIPTTPTTLPYVTGSEIHLGARVRGLTGEPSAFISRGDTTIYWDIKTERWWRVWAKDGSVEQFGPPAGSNQRPWEGWFDVVVSADGRRIAVLTHPTQNTSRITEYDAAGQEEIAHVDLPQPFANWTGGGDSVDIMNVTNSGQVIWAQMDPTFSWQVWKPSMKAPAPLNVELDGNGVGYPPDGGLTADGDAVAFDARGAATRIGLTVEDAANTVSIWSPSGESLATNTATGPEIARRDGGQPVQPPNAFTVRQWLGFESEAYVIGAATVDNAPTLVRCATDRSACASIGPLPANWPTWKWATSAPTGTAQAVDPIAALPQGAPADIPTLAHGTVRVGDQVIAQHVTSLSASSDRSVLLMDTPGGGAVAWSKKAGSIGFALRQRFDAKPPTPVLSPDGRYAVTVHLDTIEEWSLPDTPTAGKNAEAQLLGSLAFPGASTETLGLLGVDDSGRVYAETYAPRSGFTWKPGSSREPLTGIAAELAASGLGGMGPSGAVAPPGCDGATGGVSPSGAQALCDLGRGLGVGVTSVSNGTGTPLGVPAGVPPRVVLAVGFESNDAVLVTAKADRGRWLLRCPIDGSTCQRVSAVPPGTTYARLPGVS